MSAVNRGGWRRARGCWKHGTRWSNCCDIGAHNPANEQPRSDPIGSAINLLQMAERELAPLPWAFDGPIGQSIASARRKLQNASSRSTGNVANTAVRSRPLGAGPTHG